MQRTAAMAVLSLVLVGAAIGLPVAGILWHRAAERDLSEARLARTDLQHTFVSALSAQAAVSGYVITGDRAFLESHLEAVEGVEGGLRELRSSIGGPEAREQAAGFASAFQRWQAEAAEPQVQLVQEGEADRASRAAPAPAAPPVARARRPGKLTFNEQRELEGIEPAILGAEERQGELERALSDPATYQKAGAGVAELRAELERMSAEVERLYARWQELEALRGGG